MNVSLIPSKQRFLHSELWKFSESPQCIFEVKANHSEFRISLDNLNAKNLSRVKSKGRRREEGERRGGGGREEGGKGGRSRISVQEATKVEYFIVVWTSIGNRFSREHILGMLLSDLQPSFYDPILFSSCLIPIIHYAFIPDNLSNTLLFVYFNTIIMYENDSIHIFQN